MRGGGGGGGGEGVLLCFFIPSFEREMVGGTVVNSSLKQEDCVNENNFYQSYYGFLGVRCVVFRLNFVFLEKNALFGEGGKGGREGGGTGQKCSKLLRDRRLSWMRGVGVGQYFFLQKRSISTVS